MTNTNKPEAVDMGLGVYHPTREDFETEMKRRIERQKEQAENN